VSLRLRRAWALVAATLTAALAALGPAACGLGLTGSAEPPDATPQGDASYELPAEDDASADAGAGADASADAGDAAPACRDVGARCSRQSDCCTPAFCGRQSYYSSYECQRCLGPTAYCSSDYQCCSKQCDPVSQYSRRCR
jgi:UPF0506